MSVVRIASINNRHIDLLNELLSAVTLGGMSDKTVAIVVSLEVVGRRRNA